MAEDIYDILARIDGRTAQTAEDVAALNAEVFGKGNKPGLSANVQSLMSHASHEKKSAARISTVAATIVSTIVAGVVAALSAMGVLPTAK